MAWTSLTFSFGAVLTSTQMNQLQANFSAVANGDAGAPRVKGAGLSKSVVASANQAISALTYWIPSDKQLQFLADVEIQFELYIAGAWKTLTGGVWGAFLFDGANMRFFNTAGVTRYVYYQEI